MSEKQAAAKPIFVFSRRVIEQAICEADEQVAKLRACEIKGNASDGEATGLRDKRKIKRRRSRHLNFRDELSSKSSAKQMSK